MRQILDPNVKVTAKFIKRELEESTAVGYQAGDEMIPHPKGANSCYLMNLEEQPASYQLFLHRDAKSIN